MHESSRDDIRQSDMFNETTARRERLAYRIGGEQPTERALGIDEAEARIVDIEIEAAKAERKARQDRLVQRLGETGGNLVRPE